jgi:phage portal protein BeeE
MGLFSRRKVAEQRAETTGTISYEDALLQALLGSTNITKSVAMQIPTVASAIGLIADIIAGTPIKLYKEENGKTE